MQNTLLIRLKKFFKKEKPKEQTMAKKKTVKFKVTDGKQPKKLASVGGPFGLRAPMNVNIPARSTRTLKLGLSCELPVLVTVGDRPPEFFAPGVELSVTLGSRESTDFSEGEVVAKAFVLDNSDVELAE